MSASLPLPRRSLALVVEDDPDAAEVASGMLGLLGYRVRVAPDGNAALQALAEERPELVLLDICLPHLDGITLMQVAERFVDMKGLRIVAASAVYASDGTEAKVLARMGVTNYLPKPFGLDALRAAIAAVDPDRALPATEPVPGAPRASRPAPLPQPLTFRVDDIVGKLTSREGETTALLTKMVGNDVVVRTSGGVPHEGETLRLEILHRYAVDDAMQQQTVRVMGTATRVREEPPGARVRMAVTAAAPADGWRSVRRLLEMRPRD